MLPIPPPNLEAQLPSPRPKCNTSHSFPKSFIDAHMQIPNRDDDDVAQQWHPPSSLPTHLSSASSWSSNLAQAPAPSSTIPLDQAKTPHPSTLSKLNQNTTMTPTCPPPPTMTPTPTAPPLPPCSTRKAQRATTAARAMRGRKRSRGIPTPTRRVLHRQTRRAHQDTKISRD